MKYASLDAETQPALMVKGHLELSATLKVGKKAKPGPKRFKKKSDRAYGSVTINDIIDAALALIQRSGLRSLSMRALTNELKMSNMAVYYYVDNKEQLLDLILDRVIDLTKISEGPGDFFDRYTIGFHRGLSIWRNYPGLSLLAIARIHSNPNSDGVAISLRAAGLSERQTAAVTFAMGCHFYGAICAEPYFAGSEAEYEQQVSDSLLQLLQSTQALIRSNASPVDEAASAVDPGGKAKPAPRRKKRPKITE